MEGVNPLILGAAIGSAFTIVVQLSNWLASSWRNRRYAAVALELLENHYIASQKSLDAIPVDAPLYLRVARIRFCKTDRAHLPDALQQIGLFSNTNHKARGLMVMVRNSDVFLDEIAQRFDSLTEAERVTAIADAKVNVAIMLRFITQNGLHRKGHRPSATLP